MNDTETGSQNWFSRNRKWFIPASILLTVALLAVGVFGIAIPSWAKSVRNEGVTTQNKIVTLQKILSVDISNCLDTSKQAAQITDREFASLKDVLTNVVAARYDGNALSQGGALISSLQENYPTIDQSSWKILMARVIGCRDTVAGSQSRLQNAAKDFNDWRMTGNIFNEGWRQEFPNDQLQVIDVNSGQRLKGMDALEYLINPVLTKAGLDAMKKHELPDQELFPSSPAQPTSRPTR